MEQITLTRMIRLVRRKRQAQEAFLLADMDKDACLNLDEFMAHFFKTQSLFEVGARKQLVSEYSAGDYYSNYEEDSLTQGQRSLLYLDEEYDGGGDGGGESEYDGGGDSGGGEEYDGGGDGGGEEYEEYGEYNSSEESGSDPSCMSITVETFSGIYPDEISWYIHDHDCKGESYTDSSNIYHTSCCVATPFIVTCEDSYGDGWNAAYLSIQGAYVCQDFTSGFSHTAEVALDFA
eukprot:gene23643-28639_t